MSRSNTGFLFIAFLIIILLVSWTQFPWKQETHRYRHDGTREEFELSFADVTLGLEGKARKGGGF